jgi:hypothetical protein
VGLRSEGLGACPVTDDTRDIRLGLAVVDGEGCDDPDCEDCARAALARMDAEDDDDDDA